MKRIIRYNIFESNSSSSHTISVGKRRSINDYYHPDEVIMIELDEYGWAGDPLYGFYSKLAYAMSMILHTEYPGYSHYDDDFTVDQEKLEELDGYKILLEAINEHGNCEKIVIKKRRGYYPYGYIDHQSYENYSSLADFLADWEVDAERYLFDDTVVVYLSNDNY